MSCLLNFLILLPCTILILNCSPAKLMKNDEKSTDSVEDAEIKTAEFDDEEKKFLPDDKLEREKFKKFLNRMNGKGYGKGYTKGQLDTAAQNFIRHFHCANDHAKICLENISDRFKEHFNQKHIIQYIQGLKVEVPEYILQTHVTNDLWTLERVGMVAKSSEFRGLLEEDFLKTTTPSSTPAASTVITGKTLTEQPFGNKLKTYFRLWYYIITVPCPQFVDHTVMYLQSSLDKFFDENKHKYTDKDTFYRICAAHLARSYLLTCAVHHHWIQRLEEEMSLPENQDVEFESVFLDVIPTWCMEDEQITMLNHLRVAVHPRSKTIDPIQALKIQDPRAVSGKDGEINVIPYLISSQCGKLDWDKAITSKHLPWERTSVCYKRSFMTNYVLT